MAIDDGFYNPQPKTQTSWLGLFFGASLEAGEDGIRFGRRGTWTLVLDPALHTVVVSLCTNPDNAPFGSELVGVGQ